MKKLMITLLAVAIVGIAGAQTKTVSILGDSYSTYEGYVTPSTNELWYYAQNAGQKTDVKNVRQTWWHQVISEQGWRLCVNNSYSGATISYTGYDGNDYSARSFNTRMNDLGQPDVIFIFGATNDSWAGTPIGEYKYEQIGYGDLYAFRPALAYLLQRMKDRYVNTDIYFLLNNELREEISSSVKTICEHYAIPVVELKNIDKLSGHPSVKGMRQIADQVNAFLGGAAAGAVNDNNTPLHLMKPAYRLGYGISKTDDVKAVMDRVLRYIDAETPAELVDSRTGQRVTDLKKITADTQLKQGAFRLTSYEWGVTYSGALAAYQATGDKAYLDYVTKRHQLLADIAPAYQKIYAKNRQIDGNIRRVIDPHALDDAGAVCCSMIKSELMGNDTKKDLRPLIDRYADYIINKEYRLQDGTFARIRPQKNTLWLDDMFMGIPTVAYMGRLTGDAKYYDEAARQVLQFAERMWVPEKGLFRHGWVEAMEPHPAFHWGRANGWAILTMCEVLDVLPENHPQRGDIMKFLKAHAAGLARLQHHDGFWHQLLDRDDTYLEASATAIYTYCLAHAVNKGWIDAKAFGPVAQLGWHAVASSVNRQGQVERVCVGTGMGFDPAFYAYRPCHVMAAHGYGPVLWAGAEIINMLKQQHPKSNDSAVMYYDEPVATDAPIFNYDGSTKF